MRRTHRTTGAKTEPAVKENEKMRSSREDDGPNSFGSRAPVLVGEPTKEGRFGEFGGRFVPESLVQACVELEVAFREAWADPEFRGQLSEVLREYGGRPTPVTRCAAPFTRARCPRSFKA